MAPPARSGVYDITMIRAHSTYSQREPYLYEVTRGEWTRDAPREWQGEGMCATSHSCGAGSPMRRGMPREILPKFPGFASPRTLVAMREMARLSGRLQAMGIPVAELESSGGLPALWLDRGALNRPAAVLSTELTPDAFEEALDVVCRLAAGRPLSLLPYGTALKHPERLRLRTGDVALPIYEPLDPSALRFQVNRAIAPISAPDRGARRAPIEQEMLLKFGMRTRTSRVYTMSSRGAFLLLDRPLRPGRRVDLEVPVGGANHPRASGRVTFVNRVNAPAYPDLPPGVAICFDRIDAIAACAIDHLVERRLNALEIQG